MLTTSEDVLGRFDLLEAHTAGRGKCDCSSLEITHLSMSAAPNAFVFLILLAQIELVHCWPLFQGRAPTHQENTWRLVWVDMPSGCSNDLGGGISEFRGRSDKPQGYLAKGFGGVAEFDLLSRSPSGLITSAVRGVNQFFHYNLPDNVM